MTPAAKFVPKPTKLPGGLGTLVKLDTHSLLESASPEASTHAARDFHNYGPRANHPLKVIEALSLNAGHCIPSPQAMLERLVTQTGDGTLVITGIEDLPEDVQLLLITTMESQKKDHGQGPSIRIVLTATDPKHLLSRLRARLAYFYVR
jgi:hypothetical protein